MKWKNTNGDSADPSKKKDIKSLRRCVTCFSYKRKENLLRFAQLKDKTIIWEGESEKRPRGKGIYLCRDGACISRFVEDKKFRKRFREKLDNVALEYLKGMMTQDHNKGKEEEISSSSGEGILCKKN